MNSIKENLDRGNTSSIQQNNCNKCGIDFASTQFITCTKNYCYFQYKNGFRRRSFI